MVGGRSKWNERGGWRKRSACEGGRSGWKERTEKTEWMEGLSGKRGVAGGRGVAGRKGGVGGKREARTALKERVRIGWKE